VYGLPLSNYKYADYNFLINSKIQQQNNTTKMGGKAHLSTRDATEGSSTVPTPFDKDQVQWVERLKDDSIELRVTGADVDQNPTLEIALLMDCTSSMASWINKAK
jgi:hypothetical protein